MPGSYYSDVERTIYLTYYILMEASYQRLRLTPSPLLLRANLSHASISLSFDCASPLSSLSQDTPKYDELFQQERKFIRYSATASQCS